MDVFCVAAVVEEMKKKLAGRKIVRIKEEDYAVIRFDFYGKPEEFTLSICLNSSFPAIYCGGGKNYAGESSQSLFLQFMKKNLTGAELECVRQETAERIVHLDFYHVFPEKRKITGTIELMGRNRNFYFWSPDTGRIMYPFKSVDIQDSPERPIFIGAFYNIPPLGESINALNLEDEQEFNRIAGAEPSRISLLKAFKPMSPDAAGEIVERGKLFPGKGLFSHFRDFMELYKQKDFSPNLFRLPREKRRTGKYEWKLSAFKTYRYGDVEERFFSSMSEAVEVYLSEKARIDEFNNLKSRIQKMIKTEMNRQKKTLERLKKESKGLDKTETYKIRGQLILAQAHLIEKGAERIEISGQMHPSGKKTVISLDPALSPAMNAQKWFKKYKKSRRGKEVLERRRSEAESIINDLTAMEERIRDSDSTEQLKRIEEQIKRLLGDISAMRRKKTDKGKQKKLFKVISKDGMTIYVGRNAKENEMISFKKGKGRDFWFHASVYRGAHVLVVNPQNKETLPEATLLQAARLAAEHSKGKYEPKTSVMYTRRKHVKKIPGGAEGQVRVEEYKTLVVKTKY